MSDERLNVPEAFLSLLADTQRNDVARFEQSLEAGREFRAQQRRIDGTVSITELLRDIEGDPAEKLHAAELAEKKQAEADRDRAKIQEKVRELTTGDQFPPPVITER